MTNISTGESISGTPTQAQADQGWVPTADPASSSSTTSSFSALPTGMSLSSAQSQADAAFSGLVAPMTVEEINQRETDAKAINQAAGESTFDPLVSREKQVGGSQVSTAEGVVGQRQGFNISTAEQAFVADVQNKVEDRVREVENQKATYISQGNLAAADRADAQLQSLNEWNSQMTIAKADYALQLMAGSRDEARLGLEQAKFGLDQQAQDFNQDMATQSLAVSIGEMMGSYNGSPTFMAEQAKISNALDMAGLTGWLNNTDGTQTETLESITNKAQLALQQQGIDIDVRQLEEQIRSNKVQESLSAARLAADTGDTDQTPSSIMTEAVNRLDSLKGTPEFNDLTYNAEIQTIAEGFGFVGDGSELDKQIVEMVRNNMGQALEAKDGGVTSGTTTTSTPTTSTPIDEDEFIKALSNDLFGIPGYSEKINTSFTQEQLNDLQRFNSNYASQEAAFFGSN